MPDDPIAAQVELVAEQLRRLQPTPDEQWHMLNYLTGHSPTAVSDAIEHVERLRSRMAVSNA